MIAAAGPQPPMAIRPLRGDGDLRIAVAVDPNLAAGVLANTVATISIGLGAVHPGLGNVKLFDEDGIGFNASADRPVTILEADGDALQRLLNRAMARQDRDQILTLVVFPGFARSIHSFPDYEKTLQERALRTEKIDGMGMCGPAKEVKSLTGALKLLR